VERDPQAHLISSVVSRCNAEVTSCAILPMRKSKEGKAGFKDEVTNGIPLNHNYAILESHTKVAQRQFPLRTVSESMKIRVNSPLD